MNWSHTRCDCSLLHQQSCGAEGHRFEQGSNKVLLFAWEKVPSENFRQSQFMQTARERFGDFRKFGNLRIMSRSNDVSLWHLCFGTHVYLHSYDN
jgi:hypothetical protein